MIDILYRDAHMAVVNKPHDLLSVPGKYSPDNLFDRLRQELPNARLVHRLDMATSGLMVFALSHAAQKALGRMFEQRQVHKEYAAIVHGRLEAGCGEIVLPLICDWPQRPKQKVDWQDGRAAHTVFQVRQRLGRYTELSLYPVTGRSHQLRVHCQAIGHAIVGDRFYAAGCEVPRLMLHAERLHLNHPISGEPQSFHSLPPFQLAETVHAVETTEET